MKGSIDSSLQMLLKWRKTNLFSSLSDNARGLLLLTMPSASSAQLGLHSREVVLDHSMGSQAPSLASYMTASSGFPSLLIPRPAGHNRKKGKKKTAHLAEQMSDEAKSREYKAFEAFITSNCSEFISPSKTVHVVCSLLTPDSLPVPPQLDGSDITGQEDPLLLHAVIALMPATQAYREGNPFNYLFIKYHHHLNPSSA